MTSEERWIQQGGSIETPKRSQTVILELKNALSAEAENVLGLYRANQICKLFKWQVLQGQSTIIHSISYINIWKIKYF